MPAIEDLRPAADVQQHWRISEVTHTSPAAVPGEKVHISDVKMSSMSDVLQHWPATKKVFPRKTLHDTVGVRDIEAIKNLCGSRYV
jgi:hypothetical protein